MSSDPSSALRKIPLGSPVLGCWFNGVFAAVAIMSTIWIVFRDYNRRNMIYLATILSMFAAATLHSSLGWWFLITGFKNHGATPAVVNALVHSPVWYKVVGAIMFVFNVLVSDIVFIWRCWVYSKRRRYFVPLLTIMTLVGLVFAILSIIGQVQSAGTRSPGQVTRHFVDYSVPYFCLSLALALLATIFIACKNLRETPPKGGVWGWIEHVFVNVPIESAVMYTINMIVLVVLTLRKDINLSYPQNIQPHIAGISVTLILMRVILRLSPSGYRRVDSELENVNGSFLNRMTAGDGHPA